MDPYDLIDSRNLKDTSSLPGRTILGRKFSLEYAPAALLDADFGPEGNVVLLSFTCDLLLLTIVYPDGNRTIFSRALLDADFGPVGRNQHPARLRERTLN